MNKPTSNQINSQKWIKYYSQAVREFTFGDHDPTSHLPFNAFCFYPLYFDAWLDKVYLAIVKTKNEETKAEILKTFPGYGCLKFIFYTFVNMAAYYDYDKTKAKTIFDFFIEGMTSLSDDKNIFNEFSCKTKSKREIEKAVLNLEKSTEETKNAITKLSGVLAMYNHAIYNDYSTEYGYNIDGPYKVSRYSLLIKNYPDLKPCELWAEVKSLKINNIKIFALYDDTSLKMRFVSTHLIAKERYQDKIIKHLVLLNGKETNDAKIIGEVTEELAHTASEVYLKTKKMSFEDKKIKFLEQQGYELKGLFDLADIDWRPDKKILMRVKQKELKRGIINMSYPENQSEYEEYIGTSYLREVYSI